jgi:peroxiredoxin
MRQSVGSKAPEFEIETWDGRAFSLRALAGKTVYLAFFRYAGCPLCNVRMRDLVKHHDELVQRGVEVVAVVQSPAESVRKAFDALAPRFTIIADAEERLFALYGLEASLAGYLAPINLAKLASAAAQGILPGKMEGTKTRLPADFVIGPEGLLRDVFYAQTIGEHMPFERLFAALDRIAAT